MNNSNIVRTNTLMNATANSSLSSSHSLSAELAKAKLAQDMVRELMFGSDELGKTEKIIIQATQRVETPVKPIENLTEKQEILKETTVKTKEKQKIQKVSQQNTFNSTPVHAKNVKNLNSWKPYGAT